MFLTRLTIHGFKSFAEPTEIELTHGLTAIVGPNGCGKSNVIDAIRWALGEQSARSLRGGVMQDVIFNGAGRRGPLGMAEVTLAFSNRDRLLGIERDEVRVTRRLFRDGQSEYLLNGQRVRLRDVRELLLDTGAGAAAAVFVEQGRIDALLQASPRERRQVLEEAAGIGRYKLRKKDAQDRLDAVGRDRARLLDVLKEVSERHADLARQAKKARRFVELRDDLDRRRRALASHRKARLEAERERALARAREAAAARAASGTHLEEVRRVLDGLGPEIERRDRVARELELTLRDLGSSLKHRREQAQQEGRRAGEHDEDAARAEYQLKGLDERIGRLDREIDKGSEAKQKQQQLDQGVEERARTLERDLGAIEARARLADQGVERARGKLMDALQAEAQVRNRIAELDARARVLSGREERLERKVAEVEGALGDREAERVRIDQEAAAAKARVAGLDAALDAATERRAEAEVQIRDLEETYLQERRAFDQLEARLVVLDQLEREGQGLEPGVQALRRLAREAAAQHQAAAAQHQGATASTGGAPAQGGVTQPGAAGGGDHAAAGAPGLPVALAEAAHALVGPVADQLVFEADYAAALEALLGPAAQWLLVRTDKAAGHLLEWLGEGDSPRGRARLIALDAFLERAPVVRPPALEARERRALEDKGFLGWAAELARPSEEARAVVERLFEGACICEDLDSARELVGLPAIRVAATLDGEVVTNEGAVEGGAATKGGRLGRLAERHGLVAERREQETALESLSAELARAREVERQSGRDLETLRREHNDEKLRAFGLARDLEERDRGLARAREEARLTRAELAEVSADRGAARAEVEELSEQAIALREDAREQDEAARAAAEARQELEHERGRAREALALCQVERARGAEQWEALRRAAERAEKEREEARRERTATAQALDLVRERGRQARAVQKAIEEELTRLAGTRERSEADLDKLRAELVELKATQAEARAREGSLGEAHRQAAGALEGAERDGRDAEGRLVELATFAREELGLELAALPPPPAAEPGEPPFAEADAEREVGALKRQLQAIGAVNLEALEEHDRVEARKRELTEQTEDLRKAEENLRHTIKRLNDTSRRRFNETFEAVRGHFRDIFRKLFGGGQADLVLEPGVDVLEAGVDIVAKPPGKKARTLSLLSGGERVLATVALLFAVFRAKPGPFCILDEVDAALDEHNVGRFVALVREFLDRSQIIVVTHNKKTMAAADALYGVTMPEPGVSTPVSVRIAERPASAPGAAGPGGGAGVSGVSIEGVSIDGAAVDGAPAEVASGEPARAGAAIGALAACAEAEVDPAEIAAALAEADAVLAETRVHVEPGAAGAPPTGDEPPRRRGRRRSIEGAPHANRPHEPEGA